MFEPAHNGPVVQPAEVAFVALFLEQLGHAVENRGAQHLAALPSHGEWLMQTQDHTELVASLIASLKVQNCHGEINGGMLRAFASQLREHHPALDDWLAACRPLARAEDEARCVDLVFRADGRALQILDELLGHEERQALISWIASYLDPAERPQLCLECSGVHLPMLLHRAVPLTWAETCAAIDALDPARGYRHRLRYQGPFLRPHASLMRVHR